MLKRVALWHFNANIALARRWMRLRGARPYRLGGACRKSARCCEAPAIRANLPIWYVPGLRHLFLAWQHHVNGLVLKATDRRTRVFVFECTHFDRQTRLCDSYDSRPGMCRDYPRVMLDLANPELFPECGYRLISPNAEAIVRAAVDRGADRDQERRLRVGLGLDPDDGSPAGRPQKAG